MGVLFESRHFKKWVKFLFVSIADCVWRIYFIYTDEPLEQIHIFILANIFRRPIVVYSVKSVSSVADDLPLAYSNFQGEGNLCVLGIPH